MFWCAIFTIAQLDYEADKCKGLISGDFSANGTKLVKVSLRNVVICRAPRYRRHGGATQKSETVDKAVFSAR